jgi:hypothetical protein
VILGRTICLFCQPRATYDEYQELTASEIDDFIRANDWRIAKSMPDRPHMYVVKSKCTDPQMFERLAAQIRRSGYRVRFGKSYYTYLDWHDGQVTWVLWSMGWPVPQTIILNRAAKAASVAEPPSRTAS